MITRSRKLALLGALYFSQGLPYGFFSQGLPVLLRQQGWSLGAIGLTSLLALPWALKFLWAPAVDRWGSRRAWILALQGATVVTLIGLAAWPEGDPTRLWLLALLLLNLLSASQDIATDGLAVDLLAHHERGLANGLQVAGYRVGMIVGGGALLVLAARLGGSLAFALMALLVAAASVPLLAARLPARIRPASPQPRPRHFLRRPGALRIVLLLGSYKAGDAFATAMLRPLMVDAGFDLADIGLLLGTVGFLSGLVGALAGGALTDRLGRRKALLGFGVLQLVSVAGYALLARGGAGPVIWYLVCAVEHFAGGMATAALFTCMMDWCAADSAASDYTVQASAVVIVGGSFAALAGLSAQTFGYPGHFALATLLGAASLLLARSFFPAARARPPRASAPATAEVPAAV